MNMGMPMVFAGPGPSRWIDGSVSIADGRVLATPGGIRLALLPEPRATAGCCGSAPARTICTWHAPTGRRSCWWAAGACGPAHGRRHVGLGAAGRIARSQRAQRPRISRRRPLFPPPEQRRDRGHRSGTGPHRAGGQIAEGRRSRQHHLSSGKSHFASAGERRRLLPVGCRAGGSPAAVWRPIPTTPRRCRCAAKFCSTRASGARPSPLSAARTSWTPIRGPAFCSATRSWTACARILPPIAGQGDEAERLVDDPASGRPYLRLMADGLRQAGEWAPAWEYYQKLIDLEPDALPLDPIDTVLTVRRDRWFQGRLALLRERGERASRGQHRCRRRRAAEGGRGRRLDRRLAAVRRLFRQPTGRGAGAKPTRPSAQ